MIFKISVVGLTIVMSKAHNDLERKKKIETFFSYLKIKLKIFQIP